MMTPNEVPDEWFLDSDEDGEYGEWDDDTENTDSDDLPEYDGDSL